MRVACFSTKAYDEAFLSLACEGSGHEIVYLKPALDHQTAILAEGCEAICVFVNDLLDREVIESLRSLGVTSVALRCSGFNNVDLEAAHAASIRVARVPHYSPYAVAEHTVGLILTLNRKIHKAYNRVRENNFSLDGLLGFDLHGRTAGIVGTGAIGRALANILNGFGCRLLLSDPYPDQACEAIGNYVTLEGLLRDSDIVSLHCPLSPQTHHLIDDRALGKMKRGAMLVNTSRGGLVDAVAAIRCLKTGQLGGLALDVYEEESGLFFEDLSGQVIQDDVLSRLMTFPNVLVTAHQAFFTRDALETIAETTIRNLTQLQSGGHVENEVRVEPERGG